MNAEARDRIIDSKDVPWSMPPGHFGAYSKFLINKTHGSKHFDFRVSLYPPGGFAQEHTHETAEHVYFILNGRALMSLDEEPVSVGPGEAIFIGPGTRHSISSNGLDNLYFVVVTSPPGELLTVDTSGQPGVPTA